MYFWACVCLPRSIFVFVFLYFIGYKAPVFQLALVCKAEFSFYLRGLTWPQSLKSRPQRTGPSRSGRVYASPLLFTGAGARLLF